MGSIAVLSALDVAAALRGRGCEVIELAKGTHIDRELRDVADEVDAIVIGHDTGDPIQTAQRAYRLDPMVSVIFLGNSEQCDLLRGALRFTPFIGKDVECKAPARTPDVLTGITSAAARTRARRGHRLRLASLSSELAHSPSSAAAPPVREQFLTHLVDTAPIGIIALDSRQRVLSVNHEASRLLHQTERDLLGNVLEPRTVGAGEASWTSLLGESQQGPALGVFEHPCGNVLEVRITAVGGASGEGYLVLLQDVTEGVRAAEARDDAVRRAEEASRLKDEFMAMVSHELRTPMNAIVGWSRMIRAGRVPAARIPNALDVIERNATAQAKLIEDLLDVSRIIGGKMQLDVRPTSMGTLVTQAVDSVRIAAAAKGVTLSVDVEADLPEVLADADRIGQVAWNLLSNAVKFTPPMGTVRICVRLARSGIELVVADNGEGIEADLLPWIFDPFRQAEGGSTRRHGGLGLGLAIARRLIELHGGKLSASSAGRGLGATFTVRIPIQALRATGEGDAVATVVRTAVVESATSDALRSVRVLVVEDDDDTRDLVAAVMEAAGATVEKADSAAAALEKVRAESYDVVISDIGMPVEDGYALVAQLRGDAARPGKRLATIALTANAREVDRERALGAGFDAHAAKPIDPLALVSLVESVLAKVGEASSVTRSF